MADIQNVKRRKTECAPYLINVHENYDTFQLQELPVEGPVLGEVRLGRAREGDARDEGPEGESSGKGYNTLVPCMNGVMGEGHSVVDLEEFKRRFKEMTGGLFEGVDWSNIVVIGGSIVSSLMGRNEGFEESDVDVYLYGIYDKEEAGRRIAELRKHFMKVAKGECATMRTPCTITMGFGKPYRNIQVITSPWASVDHILSTCDVDCSAVGFDGHAVYATPRARLAFNHRISAPNNRSLRIRGSNSYSKRLVKYCKRGFSVVDFFTPPDTLALYYPGRNSWTPRHIKDADFPFLTPSSVVVEKAPKTRLYKSPSPPETGVASFDLEVNEILQLLPYLVDDHVAMCALFDKYRSPLFYCTGTCECGERIYIHSFRRHSEHCKAEVAVYFASVLDNLKKSANPFRPIMIQRSFVVDGVAMPLAMCKQLEHQVFNTFSVRYSVLPFFSVDEKQRVSMYGNRDLLLNEPLIPVVEETQSPVQKTVYCGLQYINNFGHFRKMCLGLHCVGKWGVGEDVNRLVLSFCDMAREAYHVGDTAAYVVPRRVTEESVPSTEMPCDTLPAIKEWCKNVLSEKMVCGDYAMPMYLETPYPDFCNLTDLPVELDRFDPIKDPFNGETLNSGKLLEPHHSVGLAMQAALDVDAVAEAQADLGLEVAYLGY